MQGWNAEEGGGNTPWFFFFFMGQHVDRTACINPPTDENQSLYAFDFKIFQILRWIKVAKGTVVSIQNELLVFKFMHYKVVATCINSRSSNLRFLNLPRYETHTFLFLGCIFNPAWLFAPSSTSTKRNKWIFDCISTFKQPQSLALERSSNVNFFQTNNYRRTLGRQ